MSMAPRVHGSTPGGGYSQYEAEPSYQESVQQTGMRSTPDVAFDGDPNTGVEVYSTDPITGQGSWQVVGGTSVGGTAWAGIIAIVNQGRRDFWQGKPGRPNANPAFTLRGPIDQLPLRELFFLPALSAADSHPADSSPSATALAWVLIAQPARSPPVRQPIHRPASVRQTALHSSTTWSLALSQHR